MTRINLITPLELSDQHLIAEYREIFMVGSALQRSMRSTNWNNIKNSIPKEFTLNKGHVKFFYNKGKYLHKRYLEIVSEMKRRGMSPNPQRKFKKEQWPEYMYNDWQPNNRDIQIIKERIRQKILKKPHWYRWSN